MQAHFRALNFGVDCTQNAYLAHHAPRFRLREIPETSDSQAALFGIGRPAAWLISTLFGWYVELLVQRQFTANSGWLDFV